MDLSSPSNPSVSNKIESSPSKSNCGHINTPEKAENPPRKRCLISVKQVREAALMLRSSVRKPDPDDTERVRFKSGSRRKLRNKKRDVSVELPDKYELLCKFFNSLDSSLRLLRLMGKNPSLKNISPQIECMTDRKFSIAHLAQLKHILPEAIKLKKVLVYDEEIFCMKPDVHVTLNSVANKNGSEQKSKSGRPDMKRIFRARLLDFIKAHPEENVPEGPLPEPFNRSQISLNISSKASTSSTLLANTLSEPIGQTAATPASHLSQTFRPHFSNHVSSSSIAESEASSHFSRLPDTPIKLKNHFKNKAKGTSNTENTPGKVDSTPVNLMSATPALAPPKRCYTTPNGDSAISLNKLVRRPASRSLKFDTPVKSAEAKNEVELYVGDLSSDDDILGNTPGESCTISNHAYVSDLQIREKEMKIHKKNYSAISQAKRRKQMIANLPKFFDIICFCFQSSKHSLITKEELLHRLVTPHLDIIDKEEVEDQLVLLKELVPDLIYEKLAPSGELFVGINKLQIPDLIRARLVEAK